MHRKMLFTAMTVATVAIGIAIPALGARDKCSVLETCSGPCTLPNNGNCTVEGPVTYGPWTQTHDVGYNGFTGKCCRLWQRNVYCPEGDPEQIAAEFDRIDE